MVEVKRKKGETFDGLLKRFQGRFRQSGLGQEVRREGRRFFSAGKNKTKRRESALRRVQKGQAYAYLAKTGQLKEEPKKTYRR